MSLEYKIIISCVYPVVIPLFQIYASTLAMEDLPYGLGCFASIEFIKVSFLYAVTEIVGINNSHVFRLFCPTTWWRCPCMLCVVFLCCVLLIFSVYCQSTADLHSLTDSELTEQNQTSGVGIMPDVKEALLTEIKLFNMREKLIYHFKVSHRFISACLCYMDAPKLPCLLPT